MAQRAGLVSGRDARGIVDNELGEVWPMGDSPPVLVTALTDESSRCTATSTPGGAERRTYTASTSGCSWATC